MDKSKNEKFIVTTVELDGNNTIEASAGTGKTYSLAVLVVRLLLEKQLPIEEILLVTFTKPAAAELKERTAKFIRLALKEANEKGSSGDKTIEEIVSKPGLEFKKKIDLLQKALLDLDKATMATIHSFCQQTLIEFAFETGQVFGKELITDNSEIINQAVENFMRREIAKKGNVIQKGVLIEALKNALNGKYFFTDIPQYILDYSFSDLEFQIDELEKKIKNYFHNDKRSKLRTILKTQKIPGLGETKITKTLEILESNEKTLNAFIEKNPKPFVEYFSDDLKVVSEMTNLRNSLRKGVIIKIITENIKENKVFINKRLTEKNALTFNDLIEALYEKRDNKDLKMLMREKYKAVFVDEFQDTDPKQYGIFKSFFQDHEDTVLFFIGDPKQSIYGWRQADVETYKQARDSQNMKKLEMNINYRSSAPFINAANTFFELDEQSNLEYIKVNPKDEYQEVGLRVLDEVELAIQLLKKDRSQTPEDFTAAVFRKLFSNETQLVQNKNDNEISTSVTPENIAVLVRSAREGIQTKRVLNKLGIPSIIIAEQNVFNTQEAKNLKIILNAVLNINQGNVYYALITQLVGKSIENLKSVDEDAVFPVFYNCKAIWEKDGISKMMETLMQSFSVVSKHENDIIKGHQTLANTKQLIDILQNQTIQEALTPSEVYAFLSNQIKNPDGNNESYQQTVENDEKAVRIMTIHKSKGLEFDVVVLPYLSLTSVENKKWKFTSFRAKSKGSDDNKYYFAISGLPKEQNELFVAQTQAENERLLYVALTRAKYNAFIFEGKSNAHLLSPYFTAIVNNKSRTISCDTLSEFNQYDSAEKIKLHQSNSLKQATRELGELSIADKNYFKLSYSFLASKHQHHSKGQVEIYPEESYDHFIFKELPKGAHIGNVLHDLFEFCDFTSRNSWSEQIEKALGRYYPSVLQEEKVKERYVQQLLQLMKLVVETPFEIKGRTLSLNQVDTQHRVNELEFNFPIPKVFNPSALEDIIDSETDERKISTNNSQVYGMMNGFVDLFFEHNGKYYILDWKSNFLGDQVNNYSKEGLMLGMNESNYHLQYLLYTVAIDKYLNNRLGENYNFDDHFGGVVYVFLRGVRENEKTGFFVQDVKKEELSKLRAVLLGEII